MHANFLDLADYLWRVSNNITAMREYHQWRGSFSYPGIIQAGEKKLYRDYILRLRCNICRLAHEKPPGSINLEKWWNSVSLTRT